MPETRVLLTNLNVEEISGVDKAANLYEGWLVMKSEGGEGVLDARLQELLDQADLVVEEVEGLHKSLDTEEGIFAAAPDDVKKAVGEVRSWLDGVLKADTQTEDRKPGLLARAMAALMGSGEVDKHGGPTDLVDDQDWSKALEQFKQGSTKEEVGA